MSKINNYSFTNSQVEKIGKIFGEFSKKAINSKPELILYIFKKELHMQKLILMNWLDEAYVKRAALLKNIQDRLFKSGNTFTYTNSFSHFEELKWLEQYGYVKTFGKNGIGLTTMANWRNEETIGKWLKENSKKTNDFYDFEKVKLSIDKFEKENKFKLTEEQKESIHFSLKNLMNFITGSAGSGKTTTLKALTYVAKDIYEDELDLLLISPTGKAAKRLSQVTGLDATTIHRALKIGIEEDELKDMNIWDEEESNKIKFVIIDEVSMVSLSLLAKILKKHPGNVTYTFVGDDKQLPPVEPGNFLDEVIRVKVFPLYHLNKIQRQDGESGILNVAYNIIEDTPNKIQWQEDAKFKSTNSEIDLVEGYLSDVQELGVENVVILASQKGKNMGVINLNAKVKELINPKHEDKEEITIGNIIFRVGDMVMNTKNTFLLEQIFDEKNQQYKSTMVQTEIYIPNGQVGKIVDINMFYNQKFEVIVETEGKFVSFPKEKAYSLLHAYALTIHKSQGSEYKRVHLAVPTVHAWSIKENILYTGVTRAKEKLRIYGDPNVFLRGAVKKDSKKRESLFMAFYNEKL